MIIRLEVIGSTGPSLALPGLKTTHRAELATVIRLIAPGRGTVRRRCRRRPVPPAGLPINLKVYVRVAIIVTNICSIMGVYDCM